MALIIAGFSGIGKTILGKKYKNVLDLDAAEYAYDDSHLLAIPFEARKGMKRKPNLEFPNNYIQQIKKNMNKYDIILVWDREDIIEEYIKNNIEFSLCYPQVNDLEHYINRFRNRGNSEEYIKMKLKQYYDRINTYKYLRCKRIVLTDNQTLEDYLLSRGVLLVKKD